VTFQGGDFEGGRVQRSSGGGRRVAVGGGVGGLIIALLVMFGVLSPDQAADLGGEPGPVTPEEVTEIGDCSVEEANTQRDCRLAATAYALDEYWEPVVTGLGGQFAAPGVTWFSGSVDTGCGAATSAVGPFYCPPDQRIYIDLEFYDTLYSRFGAQDGALAEMYVTAHEYGHHVQDVLGIMDAADRGGSGAESDSVRIELQADCFAGMWVGEAATVKRPGTDMTFLEPITEEELRNALAAAAAVGDDRIQRQATGSIDPDSWTHGSSEQRQRWFTTGYQYGDIARCDTFSADLG
jgi:predicted metalloprotease